MVFIFTPQTELGSGRGEGLWVESTQCLKGDGGSMFKRSLGSELKTMDCCASTLMLDDLEQKS